jgi:hypothetical protein
MVIEVMGRNCGYLALVSALALEATFTCNHIICHLILANKFFYVYGCCGDLVFPESPPGNDWPEFLCQKIEIV